MGDIIWLLNSAATHPDATFHYHSSYMTLHVSRDASYLCEEFARSRAGGHFFLADQLVNNSDKPPTLPTNNGSIRTLCQIIKTVMSSASEAEIGATFLNAKYALSIFTTLEELGYTQPPTPMQVDNTTAVGFEKRYYRVETVKVYLHALLLDQGLHPPGPIQYLLGSRKHQPRDYHTKHHSLFHY